MARALIRGRGALALSILLCLLLFAVGAALSRGFATRYGVNAVLVLASFLGVAAAGQTLVVLLGGIDLSIPYVIGLADVVGAELTQRGWPFGLTAALVLAIALAVGCFNGFVSARRQVHPLIVTLGVGFVVQGGVQIWTGGRPSGLAPAWINAFVSPASTLGPLPVSPIVLFWALFAAAVLLGLRFTAYGRRVYLVGANPTAARLALVSPTATWTVTFGLSAVCAADAGLLLLGFSGSAYATIGDPYLFLSVGAVVVGGTSLLGGRGGYAGTVVGAVLLTELATLLVGRGVSQSLEQVVLGLVIIAVVAAYGREPHIRTRI